MRPMLTALVALAAVTLTGAACAGPHPASAAAPAASATACPSPGQFSPRSRPSGVPAGAPTGTRVAPAASGTVASIKGDRLVVDDRRSGHAVTVVAGASTQVRLPGGAGRLSDIRTGESVVVMGTRQPDGTVDAIAIQVQPAGSCFRGRTGGRPFASPTPS